MSVILGIHDSTFDSGSTLLVDGKVVSAIHEERVNRIKHSGGFPRQSIKAVLDMANLKPSDIDAVAVGFEESEFPLQFKQGFFNSSPLLNPLKRKSDLLSIYLFEKYTHFYKKFNLINRLNSISSDSLLKYMLKKVGINAKIQRIDHHLNHAASAFYSSGFKKCLIITADARGDGLSTSISIGEENKVIERLSGISEYNSLGHFYGGLTEAIGYDYANDEGKTEALAEYGQQTELLDKFRKLITVDKLNLNIAFSTDRLASFKVLNVIKGYKTEDVAFAAQRILEEACCRLIQNAIDETGIKNLALAGGLFLNVKLNQKIMDMADVKDMFIHPAAGDGGIPTGAAFNVYAKDHSLKSIRWEHAYLGNECDNKEIKKAIDKSGYEAEYIEDISGYVGEELLPKGYIIGWFQDKMEYGPRALGSRSVLITPKDPESPKKIRSTIKRRPPFQPFCPSMLKSCEKEYVQNPKSIDNPFMIITFTATPKMEEEAPAVVFVDKSARVQTVDDRFNKRYYDVIKSFGKATGTPILLNTSFNRSGEAIVYKPEQAIYDIEAGKLDYLAIGNYLIKNKRI